MIVANPFIMWIIFFFTFHNHEYIKCKSLRNLPFLCFKVMKLERHDLTGECSLLSHENWPWVSYVNNINHINLDMNFLFFLCQVLFLIHQRIRCKILAISYHDTFHIQLEPVFSIAWERIWLKTQRGNPIPRSYQLMGLNTTTSLFLFKTWLKGQLFQHRLGQISQSQPFRFKPCLTLVIPVICK